MEWTDYLRFRARLRGFDLAEIEQAVRYSKERYRDTSTGRLVVIGETSGGPVLIPYELDQGVLRPITVHATTRAQVLARIQSGRFEHV
jgi:hypothetical protein